MISPISERSCATRNDEISVGHFDSKVIVPDEPQEVSVGKRLRVRIESVTATCKKPARKIIGQWRFTSGVPDLGSNKRRLKGFGK
jgi:hypothetical protein